jgi:hypothetical protein
MSELGSRLASFFVAPPATSPAFIPPSASHAPGSSSEPPSRPRAAARVRRPATRLDIPSVGVVGDGDAAPFAVDLACALAARGRRRCAVVAVWGAPSPAPPRGHMTRAAEQLAGTLAPPCMGDEIRAGGRGVVVALPPDPAAAVVVYDALVAAVEDVAAMVLALCGPRPDAFDAVLARQSVLVLALATSAPAALSRPAADSLTVLAPDARLATVTLPAGGGLPRPVRHRAAIHQVLGTAA